MKQTKVLVHAVMLLAFTFGAGHAVAQYNWSGPYVGGTVGSIGLKTDTADYWCWYACDAPGYYEQAFNAGLTGGFNWQSNEFVYGIEADISSGADNSETIRYNATNGVTWKSEWNWLATIRGRAGLAVDRTLIYVTGGVAFADAEFEARAFPGVDRASWSGTLTGVVAGAGLERAISNNLSWKAEYLYVAMPKKDGCWANSNTGVCFTTPPDIANDDHVHWTSSASMLRIGVNWKF